jgi:hypothetical protein
MSNDPHDAGRSAPQAQRAAQQLQVILRICGRMAPPDVRIEVDELPLEGLQVWIAKATVSQRQWALHHRMARELALVGWHVEVDARRLLVLGWSGANLAHRARILALALTGRLRDIDFTAKRAVRCALYLHAHTPAASASAVAEATAAHLAQRLRWPGRLADLAAFDRVSELTELQLLLARILGLEGVTQWRCDQHLQVTRLLALEVGARWLYEHDEARIEREVLNQVWPQLRDAGAADLVLEAGRPPMRLVERRVAVSVPNLTAPPNGVR